MSQVSYGSGFTKKEFTCVEVYSQYTQTGPFVPSGPTSIQGVFTNTIGDTITATISVGAGGSISSGGLNFSLGGASSNYLTTVTFDRKFSGNISLTATSLDNDVVTGRDRVCNASIGNPDIIDVQLEVTGNCVQSIIGSNPAAPKTFGWSEVDELTFFSFSYLRNNIGSSTTFTLQLVEKSLQKWIKNNDVDPPTYVDPITDTIYTTLPDNVFEVTCNENTEVATYTKELCYKVTSPISFDLSNNPAEPWDAYNGVRPRQDGIPFLTLAGGGLVFNEFDPNGKQLYTVSGANLLTHTYENFAIIGFGSIAFNFLAFPAAVGYTPSGIAVHPISKKIYITYLDPGTRKVYLASLTGNIVNLVGDCQFLSPITVPHDTHDITFTTSGQLVFAHGSNLYLIDHNTGIINSGSPVTVSGLTASSTFSINNISRYYNGDLHISGTDSSFGPAVVIYDGENYTKISHWGPDNSTTPPDSSRSIAYPTNTEIKFNRLYIKNIETNQLSYDDRDLITGKSLTILPNSTITDCSSTLNRQVSWVEDLCYVLDNSVISQGLVQLVGGQIVSVAPCDVVGGFVSPAPVVYNSITHNKQGDILYALNPGGALLDAYTWTTISTPVLASSTLLTGFVGNIRDVRTRWKDDSVWIVTEQTVGSNRFHRFYTVNIVTGECTLQGEASYPSGLYNNISFTWGIDDELYLGYNIGAGVYRISTLSKTNYFIKSFVADVNYVISNINTDIPNKRLIVTKSTSSDLDFMTYSGDIISSCGANIFDDAMHAPFLNTEPGDSIVKVKKVFIKDVVTGDVTSYYHDYFTGEDVILPPLARIVDCDYSVKQSFASTPRVQLVTGTNSWIKNIAAPDAKSITIIGVSDDIVIDDGFNSSLLSSPFTLTWNSNNLGGNLTFTGNALASSFIVSWIN